MTEPVVVDLFVEDHAHEEFLSALVDRIANDAGRVPKIRTRSARGGHGRALAELALYQESVRRGAAEPAVPDVLVVAIDANCKRLNRARREIEAKIAEPFRNRAVVACPDPHIEKWYLADPASFAGVVGATPRVGRTKCDRDRYKRILAETISKAGYPVTLGGIEFARELVGAMDLYRAGKSNPSLKLFVKELRSCLSGTSRPS